MNPNPLDLTASVQALGITGMRINEKLTIGDLVEYSKKTSWAGRTWCSIRLWGSGKGWLNLKTFEAIKNSAQTQKFPGIVALLKTAVHLPSAPLPSIERAPLLGNRVQQQDSRSFLSKLLSRLFSLCCAFGPGSAQEEKRILFYDLKHLDFGDGYSSFPKDYFPAKERLVQAQTQLRESVGDKTISSLIEDNNKKLKSLNSEAAALKTAIREDYKQKTGFVWKNEEALEEVFHSVKNGKFYVPLGMFGSCEVETEYENFLDHFVTPSDNGQRLLPIVIEIRTTQELIQNLQKVDTAISLELDDYVVPEEFERLTNATLEPTVNDLRNGIQAAQSLVRQGIL